MRIEHSLMWPVVYKQLWLYVYMIGIYVSLLQLLKKVFASCWKPFVRSYDVKHTSTVGASFDDCEKVAVITGGSSGIGLAIVKKLHDLRYSVVVGSNSPDRNCIIGVEYLDLDLASPSSIKEFSAKIRKKHRRINLLVNCAGVMFPPLRYTEMGANLEFSVNYLGHFMLTLSLQEIIKTPTESRIINVTSATHIASDGDFSEKGIRPSQRDYCAYASYARSKHALVLFTYKLQRLWKDKNVVAVAYDPGTVNTPLYYGNFFSRMIVKTLGHVLLRDPSEAAEDVINLMSLPSCPFQCYVGWRGKYVSTSSQAYFINEQDNLWKRSLLLTGMDNCS